MIFCHHRGAKVLRKSSKRKRKGPREIPVLSQTRKPLEAIFRTSGATVTLKGSKIHADERHYGPDNDDSVGLLREFTLNDFVDAEDNITFSSKHLGCALIELEDRYAPLLPAGESRSCPSFDPCCHTIAHISPALFACCNRSQNRSVVQYQRFYFFPRAIIMAI